MNILPTRPHVPARKPFLPTGTKSLLFGVHCVAIHPIFVFMAWWQLYGFPWDLRLWIAFIIHDWGYWGSPNMDGLEGEKHVELAGAWMDKHFGSDWGDFCRYHSRFWAKKYERPFSRLCVADKLAIAITPTWLYLIQANLSGEIHEYMKGEGARTPAKGNSQLKWLRDVKRYVRGWVSVHKNGAQDTWTGTKRDLDMEHEESTKDYGAGY